MIKTINKKSRNLDAELLLKIIGRKINGVGSSKAGIKVIRDYWESNGVNFHSINMVDGSGLSRKNLVTPLSLVTLLHKIRTDSIFYNSLPQSGIDGTMKRSSWSKNKNIRAKTGTLDFVKALSGYIQTNRGDELIFSFIVNHHLVDIEKIIYIQNKFLNILEQH